MAQTSCYPECRHIMSDGRTCGSPALRGKLLCYQHSRKRTLVEANRVRRHSVALPPLENRTAIQMSLDEILAAFAAHKISRREAGTYLFALQIGELNLTRMEQLPPPDLGDPFHPHPETSGDHNSNGAPAPSAPPQVAAPPQVPECPRSRAADLGDDDSMGAPAPSAPPQVADPPQVPECPRSRAADLGDHDSMGAPAPSAPPQVADCLLDHRDTEGTHEYDPERPFPLTPRKLRERRKSLEDTLRGYREARAFYATMPQDDPNQRPPVVLAYLEKNIARVETELRFLNEQSIPDSP